MEIYTLRVFANIVLRIFMGLRGKRQRNSEEDYLMRSFFMIGTPRQIIIRVIK